MGQRRNTGSVPNRRLTGVAQHPRSAVALVPEAGSSSKPAGGHTTVAETDDTIAVDALPPAEPADPGDTRWARRSRWTTALVLVWAVLAVAEIAVFHSSLGTNSSPASHAGGAGTATHRHAQAAPVPSPTKARAPARVVRVLIPVSASAFGPTGLGSGDDPTSASMAIDASTATAWTTDWYRTAQFGGLQPGTGLLLDMGHPVTITNARIILGSASGADLQVRAGALSALAGMRPQASAKDASGSVHLSLARPHRARYLLIWFTQLPPDSAGTFKASVYDVRLKGHVAGGPTRPGTH